MNIFNISRELEDIFFQIEENGGEITPELEERLAITEDKLHDKLDSYRRVYSKFMSDAKTCKEEETRIAKLRKTKENQAERLKDTMLVAVQQFGALGKSGNRLINLPDAKLYTKASACTEVNLDRSSILMQLFLDVYYVAWEQDTLDAQYGTMTEEELLDKINKKYIENHPHDEVTLFTIEDLHGLNINFNFSYNLAQLNSPARFSLLQAWFDNSGIGQNSISADVSKTAIKAKINDGEDISIASVVYHDSLIIK